MVLAVCAPASCALKDLKSSKSSMRSPTAGCYIAAALAAFIQLLGANESSALEEFCLFWSNSKQHPFLAKCTSKVLDINIHHGSCRFVMRRAPPSAAAADCENEKSRRVHRVIFRQLKDRLTRDRDRLDTPGGHPIFRPRRAAAAALLTSENSATPDEAYITMC